MNIPAFNKATEIKSLKTTTESGPFPTQKRALFSQYQNVPVRVEPHPSFSPDSESHK